MDELTSVYIQECREQLAEMEAGLLRLEQMPDDADNLNAIFRAAHTIKGGAGFMNLNGMVSACHLTEKPVRCAAHRQDRGDAAGDRGR